MKDFEDTLDREIKLRLSSRIYYFIGTPAPGSGVIWRSLRTKSFKAAQAEKRRILVELRGLDPKTKNCNVRELSRLVLDEYDRAIDSAESERVKQKKRKTKEQIEGYLKKHIVPFFGDVDAGKITEELWGKYLNAELRAGRNRNFAYDRRFLKQCLLWGQRAGKTIAIPRFKVPKPPVKRMRRILTPNEIRLIFENAHGILKPLVLMMYKMGFRPGEVTNLKWDRVNFERSEITLLEEDVKANARTVRMNPKVREMLLERYQENEARAKDLKDSQYVFPTNRGRPRSRYNKRNRFDGDRPVGRYNKQWKRLLKRAGLDERLDPYLLRHTFLTECAKRVKNGETTVHEVCKYAGTSLREFERTYLHLNSDDTADVATLMDIGGAI